jgi:hypothetical protein
MPRSMRLWAIPPVALAALALAPAAAGAQVPCIPDITCPPPSNPGGTPPGGGPSGGTSPGGGGSGGTIPVPVSVGSPEVGIEDEGLIFTAQASSMAAIWRSMGAEYVRVQAFWNAVSPAPNSSTIPAGFDPANPNSPGYNWAALDGAVNAVVGRGLRVMLTINQSGPRWASSEPNVTTPSWKPRPELYAKFATALAKRYGPRIDRWLLGSEANQRMFLAPQFICKGRSCTPFAPHLYRALVNAAYPALKATDLGAQVLIGELAPIGSPPSRTSGLTPLLFLQEMGCVNAKFKPMTPARCRGFKAARGDGFGYHPYVNTKTSPFTPTRNKQLAKMGDLPRLLGWIDSLSARRRMVRAGGGRFPVYLTEYGYITNPPSARFGVSPAKQVLFNSASAYIVWTKRSRIKLLTQYEFNDDLNFPTGLRFSNGVPKPSLNSFPTPFFVDTRKGLGRAVFWGQVRPDAQPGITLQIKRGGSFAKAASISTRGGGYWSRTMRAQRGATYRFQYVTSSGTQTSQTFRT